MSENLDKRLLSPYNPNECEPRTYEKWLKDGYFNPDTGLKAGVTKKDSPTFSIVLPPPNVTGNLHMGSTLMLAIEDTVVRFERMRGKRTLWVPGTDHAAIATQSKVEKLLDKTEGKRKHDLGREEFLKRVDTFAKESHDTIVDQIKKIGCSVDWSREAFTLDEKRNLAVRTAFKQMYDDGIIYRRYKVINWDPKGQTVISDDEIVYAASKAKLYTFRYSKDFPISIATTRPETKVGDTGVAVHPDDLRYKAHIGKIFNFDFCGVPVSVKVVGDTSVDPAFGTGAVGVTPAHSMIDWEIAERHGLATVPVINEFAKMSVTAPELANKKVSEARATVVEWLKREGLLEKEEDIEHNSATAERTGGVIEPMPKLQWFVNVNKEFPSRHDGIKGIKKGETVTLKKLMRAVVEGGQTEIIPDRFAKVYFHWIDNLRDWCISRQIWYGHRIPVWYRSIGTHGKPHGDKGGESNGTPSDSRGVEIYCDIEAPKGDGWAQDEDTLDTWFSSGLWTFSTLGWPEKTADLADYHPTSLLETGYDILFFWVARMILMSSYLLGEIPFKTVYLHGIVRDKEGRKISKSLGNNIDPSDMITKYGADAVRMSLIIGTGPGNDSKMSEDKIRAYKHFANKIWNASRFVLSYAPEHAPAERPKLQSEDEARVNELSALVKDITDDLEHYRLHLAGEKLYHYFWHTFADIIIEESKKRLQDSPDSIASAAWTLRHILDTTLRMLHPFMPFVTEELWTMLPERKLPLLTSSWPKVD